MKSAKQLPPALEKPRQPGGIRAVFLAIAVHAAFFALIVFGVSWQSRPTPPVEAELWDKLPPAPARSAAVKPQPPATAPAPEPEPAKVPSPRPDKPVSKPQPPKPDPAIAEKLERETKDRERAEKAKRERLQLQKEEEDRKKRVEDESARKKREDDKRRRNEEIAKDAAKKDAERAREAAVAARRSEVDRFTDQIKAKIRGRANVPDTVSGKPSVQVRIRILPGGEVLEIAVTRSSGNKLYDTAIERAIRSASPLPVPPPESELFPQFRDLILNIEHDR